MKLNHNFNTSIYVVSNSRTYAGGSIKGVVTKQGIALPCTVGVLDRTSYKLIELTKTDDQGKYQFHNLNKNFGFMVMAVDPYRQYNAVIQDNVVPK